jgi:hypothetical protein
MGLAASLAPAIEVVSELVYRVFDPSGLGFPSPSVPVLPWWSESAPAQEPGRFGLIGADRARLHYRRGRYALLEAYRLSGVGPEGALLAPAYHCRTMLDPALRLSATVHLYPLNPDLSPRLEAIDAIVAASPVPVRAMLLTHFFGLLSDARAVTAWCESRGIALVEDCSHALFSARGPSDRLPPGAAGRFAVASPYKLLPCEEEGWLMVRPGDTVPADPKGASLWRELRWVRDLWQRRAAGLRGRAALQDPALPKPADDPPPRRMIRSNRPSAHYEEADEGQASCRLAQTWARRQDPSAAAEARRQAYQAWVQAVAGLAGCRPLRDTLCDDEVPYMFPLVLEAPARQFPRLKRLGLPIWRWDDMAVSDCEVSQAYSEALIHLPCHQSLSGAEQSWLHRQLTRGLETN